MSALKVRIDGTLLGDEEARAFWKRFSDHMEEHKGDLAGFAKSEGLASVRPEMDAGNAVLVGSRTGTQQPYVTAPKKAPHASSGSSDPRAQGARPQNSKNGGKKGR